MCQMLGEDCAQGQDAHSEENHGKRPELGKCARVLSGADVAQRQVATLSHRRSRAVALGATQACQVVVMDYLLAYTGKQGVRAD